jgi:hypothetical protein
MDFMIDVSGYDSRKWNSLTGKWDYKYPIDWEAGKSIGLTCASIKAGEGLYEDPAFAMNWKAAQGRPREAWWFFRQTINAIAQAQKFLSVILRDWSDQDLAAIDWETMDGISAAACYQNGFSFLYEVKKMLGKVGIYTYPAYWNGIGGNLKQDGKGYLLHLAQWPLDNWIANIKIWPFNFRLPKILDMMNQITAGTMKPVSLAPWGTDIMAWQWTARAWTADIPGHPASKTVCDLNAILKPWWDTSVPGSVPNPDYPAYRVVQNYNPNVHTEANSTSPVLGYILAGTVMHIDTITNNYGHFRPAAPYTSGGWLYMPYLEKQG